MLAGIGRAVEALCFWRRVPAYLLYGLVLYQAPVEVVGGIERVIARANPTFSIHRINAHRFAFQPRLIAWLLFRGVVRFDANGATVLGYLPYSCLLPFLLALEKPWWVAGYAVALLAVVGYFYRRLDALSYEIIAKRVVSRRWFLDGSYGMQRRRPLPASAPQVCPGEQSPSLVQLARQKSSGAQRVPEAQSASVAHTPRQAWTMSVSVLSSPRRARAARSHFVPPAQLSAGVREQGARHTRSTHSPEAHCVLAWHPRPSAREASIGV